MFKPFSWMFKIDNVKEHFKYLFLIFFKFLIPSICLSCLIIFDKALPILLGYICLLLAILLFIAPFLCVQGYFWELTSNVISREWDVTSANVYNGKIKQVYKIELPAISTRKFIWRGFASIVANIIMFLPLFSAFTLFSITGIELYNNDFFNSQYYGVIGICVVYAFLAPALLWNYAKQNSIFSVLNFPKAIFIAGNYTGRYLLNCLLFAVFTLLPSYVYPFLSTYLIPYSLDYTNPANIIYVINFIIISILSYIFYLYSVFVNAYLLGTITPPSEG